MTERSFLHSQCFDGPRRDARFNKLKVNPQHPKRDPSISHPQDREFSDASHERVQKGTQISKMQCQKAGRSQNVSMPADRPGSKIYAPAAVPVDKNNHVAQDGITKYGTAPRPR